MRLSDAFLLLGLYFMTIIGRRHLILLTLLGTPILICMINDFIMKNVTREEGWEERQPIVEKVLFVFFAVVAIRSWNK